MTELQGYLPEELPDARSAQRLLALVDQLEAALRVRPTAPTLSPDAPSPGHQALETEHTALKERQAKALARLDTLLERLDAQNKAEQNGAAAEQEAA